MDLQVDPNALPEQWQQQPALMLEYGTALADAQRAEDEAKAELAVVQARLSRDIRDNPGAFGLGRATDAAVADVMPSQCAYIEARTAVTEARHHARVCKAVVDALSHRKAALQGCTDLWLRQWYAEPKATEPPAPKDDTPKATIGGRKRRRPVNGRVGGRSRK